MPGRVPDGFWFQSEPDRERLGVACAAQSLGLHRLSADPLRDRDGGGGLPRDHGADRHAQHPEDLARSRQPARIRAAHHAAHARGDGRLAGVHAGLRHAGGQEPPRRHGAGADPRHPAVGAGARLHLVYGDLLPGADPEPRGRRRAGRDLRDLHQPGLEHDLQLLPVAAHGAARPGRGLARFPPDHLAALLEARGAVLDAGPGLEHDDVDVGRLVLRGGLRSHHGGQSHHHPAWHRRLPGAGDLGQEHRRDRLGDPGHDGGDPGLRPVAVPPAGGLGRQVPHGEHQLGQCPRILAARPGAPHAPDPPVAGAGRLAAGARRAAARSGYPRSTPRASRCRASRSRPRARPTSAGRSWC